MIPSYVESDVPFVLINNELVGNLPKDRVLFLKGNIEKWCTKLMKDLEWINLLPDYLK